MPHPDEDSMLARDYHTAHEDTDLTDETQDFRFLAHLNSKSGQLPKRGEKDFEPHGTRHQENVLESSRQAMHDALAYERIHTPKNHCRGYYYGVEGIKRDEVFREGLTRGLEDDHVVLVTTEKGPHFKTMGKFTTGMKTPSLWLLPEEALYLVERGFLDLWWPSQAGSYHNGELKSDGQDEGIPMSLQATYAMLIGNDNETGKVSMHRYTVYGNLRRTGYVVQRAPDWKPSEPRQVWSQQITQVPKSSRDAPRLFAWLFGNLFSGKELDCLPYGPLVRPGMYRSYNSIYQQLAILPRHKPLANPPSRALSPEDPYRVVLFIWKGNDQLKFTKKTPGQPDFGVAIVDAHSTPIPSLIQMTSLLESLPYDPPNPELKGPGKTYHRLKHGWRNVVLAVIDQGVISYLKLGEGCFGEELMYEKFDQGVIHSAKRGGGGFRGKSRRDRSRGRGRGRSRGGG